MSLTITVGVDDIRMPCPFAVKEWDARGGHTHNPGEPADWPCYGDGKLTVGAVLRWLVTRSLREVSE